MWRHHRMTRAAHPFESPWYSWPWLYRPPLYYYERTGPPEDSVVVLMAVGNPAIWWASVPAVLAVLALGIRRRDPRLLFCAGGFAATYLLWAIPLRGLLFAHYFLNAMPYACLSLGFLLSRLWDRRGGFVKTFSGGMKRRLEIARGLLHTPKILFLDEPTLGLDPQSRNQLWTHVKHLNETERVTVFLTTHYMDEADRVAHRIAIIDHGRVVAQGSSQELKAQTNTDSLEQAFLALTGSTIRDERADAADQMRQVAKMWRR